jgi:lysophospholipase L1-like esterase
MHPMVRTTHRRLVSLACSCVVVGIFAATVWAQAAQPSGQTIILDMGPNHGFKVTDGTNQKTQAKGPIGTVEQAKGPDGAEALLFTFKEDMMPHYITRWTTATDAWDKAAGLSFWVKGDGSDNWGGLELIDGSDYALRYAYTFPIDSKEWKKITVPWRELIPTYGGKLLDPVNGYKPSSFRNVCFAKGPYYRPIPSESYTVSKVALEDTIALDTKDYTPDKPGISRFVAKLKDGKPVTIVTMGDSITDTMHWANKEKIWNTELVKKLEAAYKSKITLVNPAIGGTTLAQNMVLMPQWLKGTPHPDLVTIQFAGNDWGANVRKDRFKAYLNLAVDRIRQMTGGSADILIMSSVPGYKAWDTYHELCQACSEVAKDRKTGFADISSAFHKIGSAEDALKKQVWGWDNVHMGSAGHDLIAQTMFAAIGSEGLDDLKAADTASWAKTASASTAGATSAPAAGSGEQTLLSNFDEGEDLVNNAGGTIVTEHATAGKHALKVTSDEKDYHAISLQDGRTLLKVHDNVRILADAFNPQDKDMEVSVSVWDSQTKDYNSRYNGSITLKPGKNTIDLDYSQLPRSGSLKADKPELVDPKQINNIVLFLNPHGAGGTATTMYITNVRLAAAATTK